MDTVDTAPVTISPDDPLLQYMGRLVAPDPAAPAFYWPGTTVRARFEGTSLKIHLDDAGTNWVNVLIDDLEPQVLSCTPGEATYGVAEGLDEGVHTVEVNKRTENVVINLGQNDYWLGVGAPITLAYVDFVQKVRGHHPDAQIFLALGSMDAVAPGSAYVEAAVANLRRSDPDVHAVVFEYNGTGTHPIAADHQLMSDTLVSAIRAAMPELP